MKLVDDLIFEFKGRQVVRKEGDIALAGANPSAEEMDEGTEEHVERGIDFVLNHRLQEMNCYEVKISLVIVEGAGRPVARIFFGGGGQGGKFFLRQIFGAEGAKNFYFQCRRRKY
ncbi:unnamed protein product [Meloidogyne enterolobii]|uniref:Uncharacterized protein n=1 Tax=Meloidogyne enterolobii TaxID=390850 RepID=A0ACB0ZUS6_MELEN